MGGGSEDSLSIVRMKILTKLIYTFDAVSVKILLDIRKEVNNLSLEFLRQCKGTRLRKTTLKTKNPKLEEAHYLV